MNRLENRTKWRLRLLSLFCPPELLEEIEGDLLQKFERDAQTLGEKKAKRRLLWNTLRFFRPGIILRNHLNIHTNSLSMLSNYFKVAWRVMLRTKSFSSINIFGLALGMTGALLLFLWIHHEFSYDQFHQNKDRLYMAWNRATENGQINCWSYTPRVLAPTLKEEFAQVEQSVSFAQWGEQHLFTVGDTRLTKTSGVFTDAAFLTMFSFPLLQGDPIRALTAPNSIVLTEDFARQLFGDKNAFGETLSISQSGYTFEFVVSGILQTLPPNSDFHFEYLIPFAFIESISEKDTNWSNNSVATWVLLTEGTRREDANAKLKDVVRAHSANGQHIDIFLHPLTHMRLHSRFENGVQAGGRIDIIRMLGILGICLLCIAVINFVNLSTARAQRRAKEVAVRKVTGAVRATLALQFIAEAILLTAIAGATSLAAAWLLLPAFSALVHETIALPVQMPDFWLAFFAFVLTTGLLAGSYPALYLSAFKPVKILKGLRLASSRSALRNTLVVLQFGFAVSLIVSAIVIRRQIIFVQNRDAGYSRDWLIHLPISGDLAKNFNAFHHDLVQQNLVTAVTKTSAPITEQWSSTTDMNWRGKKPDDRTDFERIYADHQPVTTFGLTLVKGRDLNLQQFASDSTAALVNETAWRIMGFENPLGETITDNGRDWHIVGVVKDFVFTSPYQKVEPIIIFGGKARWALQVAYLKLNPQMPVTDHLDKLQQLTSKHNPEYPFEYHFADVEYERKFDNLRTTLIITTVFTTAAIAIACLGLLGLATYMTEARVKEIGIRKVLGGSVVSITQLLSFGALKPIVIAVMLFAPGAWFGIEWWLQSFAYRISVDLWTFVWAALAILSLALLTISTQTIRAALANPVESLRSE